MGRILQILASSYEEHDKLDQAESAYAELRRVAIELEDVSLEEAAELGEAKTMRLKGEYAQAAVEKCTMFFFAKLGRVGPSSEDR